MKTWHIEVFNTNRFNFWPPAITEIREAYSKESDRAQFFGKKVPACQEDSESPKNGPKIGFWGFNKKPNLFMGTFCTWIWKY